MLQLPLYVPETLLGAVMLLLLRLSCVTGVSDATSRSCVNMSQGSYSCELNWTTEYSAIYARGDYTHEPAHLRELAAGDVPAQRCRQQ